MSDPVITIREIASELKLAEKTVYAMASDGDLPAFKIRGQWRVRRSDFEAWLSRKAGLTPPLFAAVESPILGSVPPEDLLVLPTVEEPAHDSDLGRAVEDLTERVPQEELHRRLVRALGSSNVRSHSPWDAKPFEMDLAPPLPQRVRVYMYNATRPPGGRPLGEHKVQLIVPGQRRGHRGSFDNGDGRIALLIGYAAEEDVYVLWDAGLYADFAWSRNVQVKTETIIQASAGKLATQERQLRPLSGRPTIEIVLAVKPRSLGMAMVRRMELTRERLLRE
ncbi:DNA binding domain-containing protein [Caballeronia temeraria]|uniref:DNA binding domain-containing protein n=1 Tax=Caballeronia temeraria TaxID=1777137 RepID=A0A158BY19_9BURK|nr:helix-turn-helix domain-containing protein [Caballeronia temeraria]SAK74998.1 DNA binding domain-containing protein [Caballeronia temeraria]